MSAYAHATYYTELRRPDHIPMATIDKDAIALAHHRAYHEDGFCMNRDPGNCENVDDTDREYADEMEYVLGFLPDWPGSREKRAQ